MRPFDRRSRLERLLDDVPGSVRSGMPNMPKSKAAKTGLVVAGGLAALTAASARISSLRRRGD